MLKFKPLVMHPDYLVQVPIQLVFGPDKKLYAGYVVPHRGSEMRNQSKELIVQEVEPAE